MSQGEANAARDASEVLPRRAAGRFVGANLFAMLFRDGRK